MMNKEIYLTQLKDILSLRLFLFCLVLAFFALLLVVFLLVRRLKKKAGYIVLLILGVLIVGGVEIIPLQRDVKKASIIILNNADYHVVESGGLRSKDYTMVATLPNSEKVYSIECGTMQEMPWEGENVTIVFAEHSKILLDVRRP